MKEHQTFNAEFNQRPEHVFTSEYSTLPEHTPVYPDITQFAESAVTAREENIFSGEPPAGEQNNEDADENRKNNRAKFSFIKNFMGAAARGGVTALATVTAVAAIATSSDLDLGENAEKIADFVRGSQRPAFTQQEGYSTEQFSALWSRDPEAPHAYDEENPTVLTEPTCTETGEAELLCLECGVTKNVVIDALGHAGADPVREHETLPTCTEAGYYEEVVYCTRCNAEVSRVPVTVAALGHTSGPEEREDEVAATCTEAGSYTQIFHCTVCGDEISRKLVTVAALGHTPGDPARENVTATCTEGGVFSEVIRCTVCGEVISETHEETAALGHLTATRRENIVAATCLTGGSYEDVTVCTRCGQEVSRTAVVIPAAGHTEEYHDEIFEQATCQHEGYGERLIVCSVCGEELGRESLTLDRLDHTPGRTEEFTVSEPTCSEPGSKEIVTFCSVCGEEISVERVELAATGQHTRGDVTIENEVLATCETDGSYDKVFYCTVCNAEIERTTVTEPAFGHDWSQPHYEWTDDFTGMTATVTCMNDQSHTMEETVVSQAETIRQATCQQEGVIEYSAVFQNSVFETQRHSVTTDLADHTPAASVDENVVESTCEEEGSGEHVVYCSVCHEELSREAFTSAPLGHDWGTPTYEWLEDDTLVYAYAVCSRNGDHISELTVEPSMAVTTQATCSAEGSAVLTAEFGNTEPFTTQTKTITLSKLEHTPGDVKTENQVAATCETDGSYDEVIYCTVCNEQISRTTVTDPATGHDWDTPSYEWEENNASVTARVSCLNDSTHGKTEVAQTTSQTTQQPTCTQTGEAVFTAQFQDSVFTTQTKTVTLEKLAHTPGDPVTLDEDYVAATCEEAGHYIEAIYCTVCGEEISRETKTIGALDHKWGAPKYEWDYVNMTCTGTMVCEHDDTHTKTSTVSITRNELTPATCEEAGEDLYAAAFTDEGFDSLVQSRVTTQALGHDYENGTKYFVWADDNSSVTGYAYCANNDDHVIEETAQSSYSVQTEATCQAAGTGVYTATFQDQYLSAAFTPKTVTIAQLQHTPGQAVAENSVAASCTEAAHYDEVIYCTVCGDEISRTQVTTGQPLGHQEAEPTMENIVDATCTAGGSFDYVYHCAVCGEVIRTEHVETQAFGHTEGRPVVENAVDADNNEISCGQEGSYDLVVYCTQCNEELSREHVEGAVPHDWGITFPSGEFMVPDSEEIVCSRCGDHAVDLRYQNTNDGPVAILEINMDFMETISSFDQPINRILILAAEDNEEDGFTQPYAFVEPEGNADYYLPVNDYFMDATGGDTVDELPAGVTYQAKLWIGYSDMYGDHDYVVRSNTVTIGAASHTHTPGASVAINAVNADTGEPAKCGEEAIYDKVTYCTECGEIVSYEPTSGPLPHRFGIIDENGTFTEPSGDAELACSNCGLLAVQLSWPNDGTATMGVVINDDFQTAVDELGQEISSIIIYSTDDTESFYVEHETGKNSYLVDVQDPNSYSQLSLDAGKTYYIKMWVYVPDENKEYTITSNSVTIQ